MLHYHWLDTSYHINIWGIVDTDNSRGYWNSQNCIGRRIHLDIWTQPSNDLRDCKDSGKKFLLYWMNHQGLVQSHKCIPGLNMNLNMIRNHWFPLKPIICYKRGIIWSRKVFEGVQYHVWDWLRKYEFGPLDFSSKWTYNFQLFESAA